MFGPRGSLQARNLLRRRWLSRDKRLVRRRNLRSEMNSEASSLFDDGEEIWRAPPYRRSDLPLAVVVQIRRA